MQDQSFIFSILANCHIPVCICKDDEEEGESVEGPHTVMHDLYFNDISLTTVEFCCYGFKRNCFEAFSNEV